MKKNADAIIDCIYFKPDNKIYAAEQMKADIYEYLIPTKEYKILDIKQVSDSLYYINTYQYSELYEQTNYVNYVKKIDGNWYYIINIRDLEENEVETLESKGLLPTLGSNTLIIDENTVIFD